MVCIDEIMDMLDWNNPPEVQKKGRIMAKHIKSINVFLQPCHSDYNKNVWDNCAIILSERTDEELRPYIYDLLDWLQDMNWPGAQCIFERLMKYKDKPWLEYVLNDCIKKAKVLHEDNWLSILVELKRLVF